jgi:1-acyl-sn-glycerol-3-phosphate acyltransferase
MRAIQKFGKQVEEHRYAACIFPEGTRAREGVMKEFNPAGLIMLMRAAPSAIIVPVAIDGSWELMRYRMRPVPFGVRVKFTVLEPVSQREPSAKAVVRVVEDRIREAVFGDDRVAAIP